MAEHLVPIFRSEKDRVNCPFYFKIKACRHGNRCSHLQNRTTISPHSFSPICTTAGHDFPQRRSSGQPIDPKKIQEHFEHFYEDIFEELNKFGEIKTQCLRPCISKFLIK